MRRFGSVRFAAYVLTIALAGAGTFLASPGSAQATSCANDGSVTNFVVSGSQCVGYITTTGSGTFTLPSDWSNTDTIEVVGGGGGGGTSKISGPNSGRYGGGGGGGGAYSKVSNITVSNGASYSVGTGAGVQTSGGSTWFNGSTCAGASVCAMGGTGGSGATKGLGGQQTGNTGSVGTVKNLGGNGGTGASGVNSAGAGGGGGAAGGTGNGNTGTSGSGTTDGAGGSGDAGSGGSVGTASGGTGGNGSEWSAISAGSGGGGGGNGISTGGTGGNYGGGGGGGSTAGSGIQGIIVITYTPSAASPTVTTSAASSITQTTAILNGNITATGGANATTEGFAYGTNAALATTIATTTASGSFGVSSFTYDASSLSCNTTYYARAYATNSGGTGYGSIASFTTSSCVSPPSVSTQYPSGITVSSATGNGAITATNGATPTDEGFVYDTMSHGDPGSVTAAASGYASFASTTGSFLAGGFTKSLSGLTAGVVYYIRAFAYNSAGYGYGGEIEFTTAPSGPGAGVSIRIIRLAGVTLSGVRI
ncbi:MAG TPA: hypothetical protein VMV50_01770 [Candidatus Paceibacterota bacterium]|nr:hypothetical protein [Candidatus Paceibacterota bacterium]